MKRETFQHVCYVQAAIALATIALATGSVQAQDGSLFLQPAQSPQGLTLENSSFIYLDLPPEARPRELQEQDIITVLVDFRSRFLSEGDAESRTDDPSATSAHIYGMIAVRITVPHILLPLKEWNQSYFLCGLSRYFCWPFFFFVDFFPFDFSIRDIWLIIMLITAFFALLLTEKTRVCIGPLTTEGFRDVLEIQRVRFPEL